LRIRVMCEGKPRPDPDQPVGGCPVKLKVEKGRWLAEIQDAAACAPTIEKMEELGPEARRNLCRHLKSDDPQQEMDLKQMRRRAP